MEAPPPPSVVFEPVEVPSTYQETIARLGIAIRIGVLAPGTRLPPERELAERLNISRSTLRQALGSLTKTGHLVALRGRSGGTFVAESPPLASGTPFPLARTRRLLDWRLALELGAAELASARLNGDGDALEAAAAAFDDEEVVSDWTRFRRADASFHVQLAQATGNDRIVAEVTRVQGELCDLFHRFVPLVRTREATAAEHRAVVKAVRAGDATGARKAMHTHLTGTEALLDELRDAAR